MLAGNWKDLTNHEQDWIDRIYRTMHNDTESRGYRSHSPCLKLRKDPEQYTKWNRGGGTVKDGPLRLRSYWIAFVHHHGKYPIREKDDYPQHEKDVLVSADDDDGDNKMDVDDQNDNDAVRRGHGKEEMDDVEQNRKQKEEFSHICGDQWCIEPTHIVFERKDRNMDRAICHRIIRKYEKAHRGQRNVRVDVLGMVNVADVIAHGDTVRSCPHGKGGQGDQQCFVNFGFDRNPRTIPSNHRRRLHRSQVRADRTKYRKGQTIRINRRTGWIGDIRFDDLGDVSTIQFCYCYGHRGRKINRQWMCPPTL